eukprot:448129_1
MKVYIYLFLLYSAVLNATQSNEPILYGVCCQFNNHNPNSNSPQIVLSTENLNINFETIFEISNGPINCIWFDSNPDAQSASTINKELIQISFNKNNQNVQESTIEHSSAIICNNHKIHIHTSNIQSKHLCSNSCYTDNQQSCFTVSSESRNIPDRYYGESNVKPLVPSMFGISGICIAFIVVCIIIYCFGVKYSRWTEEKNGNETEKVIGDVLEEIAKYTIGDDEDEGLYEDWNEYDDSDSSYSEEEILGKTILRVVSTQTIPEEAAPNPCIYSSDSDSESDEELCRQDLLVAKETLYAVSFGTNNPYSNNLPSKFNERKTSINNNHKNTPKKSPLLNADGLNQAASSSSDASNSALP